ncbi:hypothetical protein DVH24_030658 [Malus domestica]|uniref:Uncharacterized protein n=1 Tax=Malus domestica TaxID=3750 RepID=A0A498HFT3_MALDO|nr:hypothetical protein DVH24_030658 [Malus domestica]
MENLYFVPGKSRHKAPKITNFHYYHVELYFQVLDMQLNELNDRFNELITTCGIELYGTKRYALSGVATSRPGADHFLSLLNHRSTILSVLGHDHALTNSQVTSQWVTNHGSVLATFSLNFRVPTEPKASELPKGIVLGRDGNIHLRITPLGDVGCHNPPPLRARRPRRHTSGHGWL